MHQKEIFGIVREKNDVKVLALSSEVVSNSILIKGNTNQELS